MKWQNDIDTIRRDLAFERLLAKIDQEPSDRELPFEIAVNVAKQSTTDDTKALLGFLVALRALGYARHHPTIVLLNVELARLLAITSVPLEEKECEVLRSWIGPNTDLTVIALLALATAKDVRTIPIARRLFASDPRGRVQSTAIEFLRDLGIGDWFAK